MAVVPMQRVNICALKKDRKQILEALQRKSVVEICDVMKEGQVFHKDDVSDTASQLSKNIQTGQKALQILDEYAPEKKPMLAFLHGRQEVSVEEYNLFRKIHPTANKIVRRLTTLEKIVITDRAEIIKNKLQLEAMEPWVTLDIPMNFEGTDSTGAFIGILPGAWTDEKLVEILAAYGPVETKIISTIGEQTCIFILGLKKYKDKIFDLLRMNGFARPMNLSDLSPAFFIENLNNENQKLEDEIQKSIKEITELSQKRDMIQFFVDYETTREEKYEVINRLLQSEHTFILTGYIPVTETEGLKKYLEANFDVDIQFKDPSPKADVPILLKNNSFASPLESVTEGFSSPNKNEIDPTSIMSLFYYLMFGLMLSDAGYGFLMASVCGFILLKFKKMEESWKKNITMFFYCGVATVFWGVMFSSYFGDVVDVVSTTFFGKTVSIPPLWFSPTAEPMRMLVFSMALGVVHLMTGLIMKFVQCVKNGQLLDGIYDAIFWFILIVSCVFVLMSSSMFMDIVGLTFILPAQVGNIAAVIALIGAVGIIAMSGRESKNKGKRIMKGMYNLYGITGYLSDVLSYSRLLALGLATGVIGTVINKMGSMSGSGVVKVIAFVVIFCVGHTLNFAINALGAYVHTNRLQYVEFFGKFYDGGGRKYIPFSTKTKYYKIKEN